MILNFHLGWLSIFLGILAGAIQGSFFHDEDWMGGYQSWRRRLTRLGHISFFGLGIINILFALSLNSLSNSSLFDIPSVFLIIGMITMPLICYLSAFYKVVRHFFFIPVLSTFVGIAIFLWRILI